MNGKIERIAYSKTEAAEMLGVCPRTIDNMIADKQLTARKVGRRVVITIPQTLEDWLRA